MIKKFSLLLFIISGVLLLQSGCTLEKRLYNSGYHIRRDQGKCRLNSSPKATLFTIKAGIIHHGIIPLDDESNKDSLIPLIETSNVTLKSIHLDEYFDKASCEINPELTKQNTTTEINECDKVLNYNNIETKEIPLQARLSLLFGILSLIVPVGGCILAFLAIRFADIAFLIIKSDPIKFRGSKMARTGKTLASIAIYITIFVLLGVFMALML